MYNILLIDDEPDTVKGWLLFLKEKGCMVDYSDSTASALSFVTTRSYDVLLLDVILKEISGFDFCKELKKYSSAPVIFFSNLSDEEYQVQGFLNGGDDYIPKDCGFALFWEKLKARINFSRTTLEKSSLLSYPPLLINLKNRNVTLANKTILLTLLEYDLLVLMASKPYYVWSVNELYYIIWGESPIDKIQTIQVHISHMRRKLEKVFPQHTFIETVWGKGYKFIPTQSDSF